MSEKSSRIELMDVLRGLAVCLMVIHHLLYDLYYFCDLPYWLFSNPVFDVLHYVFAGLFIMLSGISSNFSHSNVKRGLKAMCLALVITLVTYFMDMPIYFGVLHFLATCMILYGLTQKLWEKLPRFIMPTVCFAGLILTRNMVMGVDTDIPYLWMFGFVTPDFRSSDYFPLLPWIFVFMFGAWLGKYIKERKFPSWFYTVKCKPLAFVGRKALLVYVLHQPILYGLVMLGKFIYKMFK